MMTEDELLNWESAKWGNQVATVYLLDSGRLAVFHEGRLHSLHELWSSGSWNTLNEAFSAIKATPLPTYTPSSRRKGPKDSILDIPLDL